ncbi:MAG TPA: PAS domain-containing protein, partial [Solirubrobacteraceae bacterium]|nr:PAS domain-containing protein [Solirubrobacteraceae bacterium]
MRPESSAAIIEIAQSAFVTLDADGLVREWNRRATELFGYSREEAVGAELAGLIVPERYRDRHREGLRRA